MFTKGINPGLGMSVVTVDQRAVYIQNNGLNGV
jgi:hypothetical protein